MQAFFVGAYLLKELISSPQSLGAEPEGTARPQLCAGLLHPGLSQKRPLCISVARKKTLAVRWAARRRAQGRLRCRKSSRRSRRGRRSVLLIGGLRFVPEIMHDQGIKDRRDTDLNKRPDRPRGGRPCEVVEKRSDGEEQHEEDPGANRPPLKWGLRSEGEKVVEHWRQSVRERAR